MATRDEIEAAHLKVRDTFASWRVAAAKAERPDCALASLRYEEWIEAEKEYDRVMDERKI